MKNKTKLNKNTELHLVFVFFAMFLFSFNSVAKNKMPDEKYAKRVFNLHHGIEG